MTDSKKTFGVIGDPVEHSKSPAMFLAAFKDLKLPYEYNKFHIKSEGLAEFFEKLNTNEISGINVTVPHKIAVMDYVDSLTPEARAIGAVNTIYHDNNKLIGHNTDGPGFVMSLRSAFEDFDFEKAKVTVIGAGGASRAICYSLLKAGVTDLLILNRTQEKAESLKDDLLKLFDDRKIQSATFKSDVNLKKRNTLINTTSLGMPGLDWPGLKFIQSLPKKSLVADIVYIPKVTPFLSAAKELGHNILTGDGMLLYQGVLAFEKMVGALPSSDVMQQALAKSLES